MAESKPPFLAVVRVWAAMAWADGVVVPAEVTAMKEFIMLSPLDEKEQATALSWLKTKVELEDDEFDDLPADVRTQLYRSAARIAALDKRIVPEEQAFLHSLRARLGLSDEQAEAIEAEVFAHQQASVEGPAQ